METNIAKNPIKDWDVYIGELTDRMGKSGPLIRGMRSKAKANPKSVIFSEADNYKMLKAAEIVMSEKIATPILLGNEQKIKKLIKDNELELKGIEIIDPLSKQEKKRHHEFAEILFEKRQRRGVTYKNAKELMYHRNYFAPMLVETGYADAMVSGIDKNYPDTIRPALNVIGKKEGDRLVSGMYIVNTKNGPIFFADTTVNLNPTTEDLVDITLQTVRAVREFNIEPRVALLSYSNFGSVEHQVPEKVRKAVEILHNGNHDFVVDGDIQANIALNKELLKEKFPFSHLVGKPANVLIFPHLSAGNIAYKLVQELGNFEVIGPILIGMNKSVHVLHIGASVNEIVNMVIVAVIDAQSITTNNKK